jgi:N-acyl-D-aspartate/D-glutamate deacylase
MGEVDLYRAGSNVGHLLPQGSLREEVVGLEDRKATEEELESMRKLAQRALDDGVWGMSTGLIYVPGSYAKTDEITSIAEVIASGGGVYASHMRGEGKELLQSIQEVLTIARGANLKAHISHIKCSGQDAWGLAPRAIELIEMARARGVQVTADQYPYIASATSLEATVIPNWARSGGDEKLLERWNDPKIGPSLIAEIEEQIHVRDDGRSVKFARFSKEPTWAGKSLFDVAEMQQKPAVEIVKSVVERGGAGIISFSMNEDDVRAFMVKDWVATASDGVSDLPGADKPHPRLYGTFARKIGLYAIREKVIPLEFAIRSATGLPADIFGFGDAAKCATDSKLDATKAARASARLARGYLKPGMAADVVVFDPNAYIDRSTFDDPAQYATGVRYVWVNGVEEVSSGHPTGALGGVALRHKVLTVEKK